MVNPTSVINTTIVSPQGATHQKEGQLSEQPHNEMNNLEVTSNSKKKHHLNSINRSTFQVEGEVDLNECQDNEDDPSESESSNA